MDRPVCEDGVNALNDLLRVSVGAVRLSGAQLRAAATRPVSIVRNLVSALRQSAQLFRCRPIGDAPPSVATAQQLGVSDGREDVAELRRVSTRLEGEVSDGAVAPALAASGKPLSNLEHGPEGG